MVPELCNTAMYGYGLQIKPDGSQVPQMAPMALNNKEVLKHAPIDRLVCLKRVRRTPALQSLVGGLGCMRNSN
jgi:hypothetical protein